MDKVKHINYNLSYSLRVFLEENVEELNEVKIIHDKSEFSYRDKPFGTVLYLHSNKESLTAGRRDYQDIFRYEIGIYADSVDELYLLEGKLTNLFYDNEIPYHVFNEEDGTFNESEVSLVADVSTYTLMLNDELSSETYHHHGLFTISIDTYIDRETGSISQ